MPAQYPSGRAGRKSGRGAPFMPVKGVSRLQIEPQAMRAFPNNGGQFNSTQVFRALRPFVLTGTTRDSAGVALGNCVVELFDANTDTKIDQTTSDGNGIFSFNIRHMQYPLYIVAYKSGSPDVIGVSLPTLSAV